MKRMVAARIRLGRLCRFIPLLFCLWFISGCLQIDYYVTINHDGSESVTAKVAAIKEVKLDKMETQLKNHGYKTSIEIKNDSVYLIATQTFPAGKWVFPYPYGMIADSVKLNQSYADYLFYKKYKLSARYTFSNDSNFYDTNLSDLDNMMQGSPDDTVSPPKKTEAKKTSQNINDSEEFLTIPVRYHFNVPGSIDTTTSTNVKVNTMNWHYKLEKGENVNIAFASTEYNYTLFIIVGLVLIALIFYVFASRIKLNAS